MSLVFEILVFAPILFTLCFQICVFDVILRNLLIPNLHIE